LTENTNNFQVALRTAKNILLRRHHFSQELAKKLEKRGFAVDIIQKVIAEFTRLNYLNDKEYGRLYIEELIRKGYGPVKIRYKLKAKGIDSLIMDELFLESRVYEREFESAESVIKKKLSQLSSENNPQKIKNKISYFLYYRGYSSQLIRELIIEKRISNE
jgi:regulatory protein